MATAKKIFWVFQILASATISRASIPLQLLPLPKNGVPMPTPQQLNYAGKINALIHFEMATFFHDGDPGCTTENWLGCDPLGGCNSSDVNSFNPTNLNISSWIETMKIIGAESAVLTAKHGCGFLLWDTNVTLPDGSPYRYKVGENLPVLEEFVQACQDAGIGYGFYFSLTNNFYCNEASHVIQPVQTLLPGQANVTQDEYENMAIALMTELWTEFGELTEIWLDGGCGSMCDRVAALIPTTLASNAVAFNGGGDPPVSLNPVRWCGTESGSPDKGDGGAVWSTADCGWCPDGSGSGSPPNATDTIWYPSGVDVTLQLNDQWFFTPNAGVHSLADLVNFYQNSVGSNGHLEIDFAIDRTGGIAPEHATRYAEFGQWITSCYGSPIGSGSIPTGGGSGGANSVTIDFGGEEVLVDRVMMTEDQTNGQNVVNYMVEYLNSNGEWTEFSSGVTVGSKRIDVVDVAVSTTSIQLTILSAFSSNLPVSLAVFKPDGCVVA